MANRGVNKVTLLGYLGANPETRYAANKSAQVAQFSLATSNTWTDRDTGEVKERVEWHQVIAFSKLGEIVAQYLRQGSRVYVEGELRTSSWEKDGVKRYRTQVIMRELQMLDGRPTNENEDNVVQFAGANLVDDAEFEDDIPF